MFIYALDFHVGVQTGEEMVKRDPLMTIESVGPSGGLIGDTETVFNPDKLSSTKHWYNPSSVYFGVSYAFFERLLCQLNLFGGYMRSKMPQTEELFDIPYFGGIEAIVGFSFKSNITIGLSGGIESIWHNALKIKGIKENQPVTIDIEQEDKLSKKMRYFIGPVIKYQIKKNIAAFAKFHIIQTIRDKQQTLNDEGGKQFSFQPYGYFGGRFLVGVELVL